MSLNLNSLTEAQILLFALVLLRMSAFVASSAVFGSTAISNLVKILLSVVLSVLVYPLMKFSEPEMLNISEQIVSLAVQEVIIGLTLRLVTRLFFFIVTMTGDLISISLGLSSAQLFNPMLGTHGNSMEQFHVTLGTLVFLALNGHHVLLSALFESYKMIPVLSHQLQVGVYGEISHLAQDMFLIAIKMSAPILISILLANISMGILGRAVPQINVLVTSIPVTISIGFVVMIVCMPLYLDEMGSVIDFTSTELMKVMRGL